MKKMVSDRRIAEDRRVVRRYAVNIDIEWEGAIGRQKGTISDVSLLGCFVLCTGEVDNGEAVKIFFPIGDGMKIQFIGEVLNHVFEIGYGVKFKNLTEPQKEFLGKLVKSLE